MSSEAGRVQAKMAGRVRRGRSLWFRMSRGQGVDLSGGGAVQVAGMDVMVKRDLSRLATFHMALKLYVLSTGLLSLSIPSYMLKILKRAVSDDLTHLPNTTSFSLTQLSSTELENHFLRFRKEYLPEKGSSPPFPPPILNNKSRR